MRSLLIACCWCLGFVAQAQYFQFSQFNFSKQRINPAYVAASDRASLSFISRDQATAGGFHINSNLMTLAYPLVNRKSGVTWSGLGISLMDDRSGTAGIFDTQEAAVSYAVAIPVARQQGVSLGIKALYHSQKVNTDGLYTGSQYIPDRGFSESVSSGEEFGMLNNNFITFSAGMHWQQMDRQGSRLAYLNVAFFDFNKPNQAMIEGTSKLSSTLVAAGAFRLYEQGGVRVSPELVVTTNTSNTVINIGAVTTLVAGTAKNPLSVDLLTKYIPGRSGIAGIQLHKENFSVGLSYDFPIGSAQTANHGAIELALELSRLVKLERKTPQARRRAPSNPVARQLGKPGVKKALVQPTDTTKVTQVSTRVVTTASERLQQKQDSIRTQALPGHITHEPLVLEKATLHFNFEFGSFNIDEAGTQYLDDLAAAFRDNPELRIMLVGHTDNVGSEKFNQRLSIQRAEKIRDFFTARGISPQRVEVRGSGEREPVAPNDTDDGKARNRRVELMILYDQ
jgi:type IX secretion system PorP/SprF family membrane protein